MAKVIFLLAMVMLAGLFSLAQTSKSDLERQRAAIQKEINDVKKSLSETKRNRKETLGQLSLIQKRLRLRLAEIGNINQQINLIQNDINLSQRDIGKLKKELDTLKMQYEKSVVYAYKNRSNYDFLNFIFSASNFNDALKRVAYLRSYRNYREQQASNIKNTQEQLEQKIATLNDNKQMKSVVLVEQNKQKKVLEVEKKEKDAVVSKLKSREKELMNEIAVKRKQDQRLASAINAAIRRAREAAAKEAAAAAAAKRKQAEELARSNPASAPKNSGSEVVSTEKKVNRAASVFDADPESKKLSDDFEKIEAACPGLLSPDGYPCILEGKGVEGLERIDYDNPGITIETEAGKAVKAVFDGEVAAVFSVGPVQGVVIKHGKYFTTYSNLSSASISKGQAVKRGQVIGQVAERGDGQSDMEFIISNEKNQNFNPEAWLRK